MRASPWCRCLETATLAFGQAQTDTGEGLVLRAGPVRGVQLLGRIATA